jgi:hypothetical protein
MIRQSVSSGVSGSIQMPLLLRAQRQQQGAVPRVDRLHRRTYMPRLQRPRDAAALAFIGAE